MTDDQSKHFNNNEICSPLGYDSVGGAMIFIESNQVHNIGRIFIDPNYQNQGIGKK
ncbi:GNAT family N-acetyltransferase [Paenibacillus lautus]|nr:GNAT family N-acetyltransferase [Paenibacillus lautus]